MLTGQRAVAEHPSECLRRRPVSDFWGSGRNTFNIPAGALYGSLALVAGGTITNAFRSELPQRRSFRAIAFIAGVAGYGALIFATWRF
jgi:hypothetical protein